MTMDSSSGPWYPWNDVELWMVEGLSFRAKSDLRRAAPDLIHKETEKGGQKWEERRERRQIWELEGISEALISHTRKQRLGERGRASGFNAKRDPGSHQIQLLHIAYEEMEALRNSLPRCGREGAHIPVNLHLWFHIFNWRKTFSDTSLLKHLWWFPVVSLGWHPKSLAWQLVGTLSTVRLHPFQPHL